MKKVVQTMLYSLGDKLIRIVEGPDSGKVISIREAYETAEREGLDLVLWNEGNHPFIGKILDFNKFLYLKKKKEKDLQKKQRQATQKVKEVKFHLGIEDGDFQYKLNHIRQFVEEGDKVNCQIVLRGRENSSEGIISQFTHRLQDEISQFAEAQAPFSRQGRILQTFFFKKKS